MGTKIQSRTINGELKHRVIEFDETGVVTKRGRWTKNRETAEGHLTGAETPEVADNPLEGTEGTAADPTGAGLGQVAPDVVADPSNG